MTRMMVALGFGLLVAGSSWESAAQLIPPPPELRGSYAPNGDCTRLPRVVLTDVLTIYNDVARESLAPLDACLSCAGGARYEGIEVWVAQLGPDGEPKQPMFVFNAGEKRDVLSVDRAGMQSFSPAVRSVANASPLRRCAK